MASDDCRLRLKFLVGPYQVFAIPDNRVHMLCRMPDDDIRLSSSPYRVGPDRGPSVLLSSGRTQLAYICLRVASFH